MDVARKVLDHETSRGDLPADVGRSSLSSSFFQYELFDDFWTVPAILEVVRCYVRNAPEADLLVARVHARELMASWAQTELDDYMVGEKQ